jgi:hypothetical protein
LSETESVSSSRDASKSIDRVSWAGEFDINKALWMCVAAVTSNCVFAKLESKIYKHIWSV